MEKQTVRRQKAKNETVPNHGHDAPQAAAPQGELLDEARLTLSQPAAASPAGMAALQRAVGNRAVQRLVQRDVKSLSFEEELKEALARRRATAPESAQVSDEAGSTPASEAAAQPEQTWVAGQPQSQKTGNILGRQRAGSWVSGRPRSQGGGSNILGRQRAAPWVAGRPQTLDRTGNILGQQRAAWTPARPQSRDQAQSMLAAQRPDERGLVERGYDPMEQTLSGSPKYLATSVETEGETEALASEPEAEPEAEPQSPANMMAQLLTLLRDLIDTLQSE